VERLAAASGRALRCAALLRNLLCNYFGVTVHTHGARLMEPNKHFVRGVLQAGVRFVKLPRGLGGQLTELVTIRNVGECPIDQIGTHENFPLIPLTVLARSPMDIHHWAPPPQSFVVSLTTYDANRSKKMQKCAMPDSFTF
jgi:hypothetical protein